jgi:hypothetical protein
MYDPSIVREALRLIARLASRASCFSASRSVYAHCHLHCVVIDGVSAATPTGQVVSPATTGPEANAIAQVNAQGRRRLLRVFVRRGLLPGDDVCAMGQCQYGGGFSVGGSVGIEAPTAPGESGCSDTAPCHRSRWSCLRILRHRYFGAPVGTAAYGKTAGDAEGQQLAGQRPSRLNASGLVVDGRRATLTRRSGRSEAVVQIQGSGHSSQPCSAHLDRLDFGRTGRALRAWHRLRPGQA